MKKIFGTFTTFFIISVMIFSLFVLTNSNIGKNIPQSVETQIIQRTNQIDDDLKYFDISKFTNTSHWINVSREIKANEFGYTTTSTKIRLYNNISEEINALNFTLPLHEYQDSEYLDISSPNGTIDTFPPIENNDSVLLTIKFPSVGYKELIEIEIIMDHPNAVSSEEDAVLEESSYPYNFNLSFIPLISIPITKYELEWEINKEGAGVEVNIENESIQPTEREYIGIYSFNELGFDIKNITGFTSINRSLLNTSKYGNYNLTALENRDFIPAYSPNLKENFTSYLYFNYFHYGGLRLEFTKLTTKVKVSEWGFITTEHEFTILNNGLKSGKDLSTALGGQAPTFPFFNIQVPEEAYHFIIFDKYGNISTQARVDSLTNKRIIEMRPRIQIEKGEEYDLTISYREATKDVAKDLGGGRVELQIPLTLNIDWIVHKLEFCLLLPWGSKYNYDNNLENIENSTLRSPIEKSYASSKELLGLFNKNGPKIIFDDFTPLSNKEITFTFGLSPFYLLQTPFSICILFLIIGFIYTIVRNISFGYKRSISTLEEIPLDLIKDFVKTYEEKTAIREQILRLDQKRKSKNISSREYEKTRTLLNNRQQRTDRSIVTVSQKLGDEGPRYRVAMRSIEIAEANREDILKNIESLERKKNQGRIGKEAYAKLKMSYNKQLRKANNEIDKVLINLRTLLTK
ncbi:MAG: hypothetical protein ACFFAU_15120 [Candidatus Hodarchaeota archaeon]